MDIRRRLLIVDDSPAVRSFIRKIMISSSIFSDFLEAGDGLDALKITETNKVDFVITDVAMPRMDGYELMARLREMPSMFDVPVIMLTAKRKEIAHRLKGFDRGASDYVVKPFDNNELIARTKALLRMYELQEELKARNEELKKMAATDELTGLSNRRHFFETSKTIIALAKRSNMSMACLMIDIDSFKWINDSYGHQAGDTVIKMVADGLLKNKRESDVLARLGGDEFIMFLFMSDEKKGEIAGESFRKTIEAICIPLDNTTSISVTLSIGCSSLPPEQLTDMDKLIAMADQALYKAKRSGKNRVIAYSSTL